MLERLAWQREGEVGGRRFNYKEVIQDVAHKGDCTVVLQYPLNGVRELIENKWCRTETKGKHFIKIVKPIPEHAQKFPVCQF